MVNYNPAVKVLNNGGLAVIPTDTVYGIVACALNPEAVTKVYLAKKRSRDKKCIILIASKQQAMDLGIIKEWLAKTNDYWPGPYSLIMPTDRTDIGYLTEDDLALRLPDNKELNKLITQTGPLIAPSANPEGQPVAINILEAKAYFGNQVDIYVDGGEITDYQPSTIVNLQTGQILR